MEFCGAMLEMMEKYETFFSRLIFSDEATFHLSGHVNRHNVRIWGTEHSHETVEHQRDSLKVNVFCAVSNRFAVLFSSSITPLQDKLISKC